MRRALIIRPSSLGDIVHALPIVHDIRRHHPAVNVDWVAEESFASLVRLNRGVDRVIPVALRRWRHRKFDPDSWRQLGSFRREVARERYDVILDLQEQVKGALMAWLARGPVHGPDRASIREPIASLFYRHRYRVDPNQHLIDRCRQIAAKAFGYATEGPPRFDLVAPPLPEGPESPYVVFLHATSRDDKLWPEDRWRSLIAHFAGNGMRVVLPWGSIAESDRSHRLGDGITGALVPRRRELPALCGLLADAALVCGVDTGLVHLAAALGTPTLSLFVATDPRLAGVERASRRARDLGGIGVVPNVDDVIMAAGPLLRSEFYS
jgi:lipopolysaccharide heptosyltransferase I